MVRIPMPGSKGASLPKCAEIGNVRVRIIVDYIGIVEGRMNRQGGIYPRALSQR